jgi:pyruvate formate lyase activating enzyme
MRLAGLQKLSLVDYPGHLASVVFVQGCNFRCGYCHNPDLVTLEKDFGFAVGDVLADIKSRKDTIEGVVVTGGEPTMYPETYDLIERIKEMGLLVKLDTNGSNPMMLLELLRDKYIDYVAMDVKTSLGKYHLVTDLAGIEKDVTESAMWVILSTIPYEFRTTCVPGIVDEKDIASIGELVKSAERYCLQQFNPAITYDPSFRDIKPYALDQIRHFAEILKKDVRTVETRGI